MYLHYECKDCMHKTVTLCCPGAEAGVNFDDATNNSYLPRIKTPGNPVC